MPFKTAFMFWLTFSSPRISAFMPLLHFRSTKRQSNDSLFVWRRRDNSKNKKHPSRNDNDVDRNYEWWKSQERFSPENLQGKLHKNAEKEQWRQEWRGMHHQSPSSEWNQQQEPFIVDAEFYDVPSIPPMEETIIEEEDLTYLENAFEQTRDTVIYEKQMNVERPYEQVDASLPWNENKVKRYNQAPIQPLEQQQRSYLIRTSSRRRPASREHASSLRRVDLSLRGKREREARQYHRTLRQTQLHLKQKSKIPIYQKIATIQSGLVGAFVGTLTMAPIAGLHHFVLFPSYYSSTAQWEWDTGTALVQGGLFAILYRFLIARGDNGVQAMQTVILSTVCIIRTVVRVQVPMYCTALPLQCKFNICIYVYK
jgi:hypothetical protein